MFSRPPVALLSVGLRRESSRKSKTVVLPWDVDLPLISCHHFGRVLFEHVCTRIKKAFCTPRIRGSNAIRLHTQGACGSSQRAQRSRSDRRNLRCKKIRMTPLSEWWFRKTCVKSHPDPSRRARAMLSGLTLTTHKSRACSLLVEAVLFFCPFGCRVLLRDDIV